MYQSLLSFSIFQNRARWIRLSWTCDHPSVITFFVIGFCNCGFVLVSFLKARYFLLPWCKLIYIDVAFTPVSPYYYISFRCFIIFSYHTRTMLELLSVKIMNPIVHSFSAILVHLHCFLSLIFLINFFWWWLFITYWFSALFPSPICCRQKKLFPIFCDLNVSVSLWWWS